MQAWTYKGYALIDLCQYDKAIQVYNTAIEIAPKDGLTWCYLGKALRLQGKYDEAVQVLDRAIELRADIRLFGDLWTEKGLALHKLGRYDTAIQAYDKTIQMRWGDKVLALINKGYALEALGRTMEANAAFAKAKELGYNG